MDFPDIAQHCPKALLTKSVSSLKIHQPIWFLTISEMSEESRFLS